MSFVGLFTDTSVFTWVIVRSLLKSTAHVWLRQRRICLQCRRPGLILESEDPLEKGMATQSSIFAWRIPWTVEPGGLESMGWQRLGNYLHFHFLSYLPAGTILLGPAKGNPDFPLSLLVQLWKGWVKSRWLWVGPSDGAAPSSAAPLVWSICPSMHLRWFC